MKNVPVTLNIKGLTDVEKERLSTMFENAGRVLRNMLAMKGRDPDKLTITVTESN